MISAKQIKFSYTNDKEFISDFNINIKKNKITTIIGPNGSGKSTLLSLLCGINKVSSGEILINNKSINNMKYKEIAKIIATVHQQNSVPSDIDVETLVGYGRLVHQNYFSKENNNDKEIIKWALESTNSYNLKDKSVMSLSGGERQRIFISMALAQKTEILFLDEPTTYLDIYHQLELLELIKKLNKENKLTVVMVLHDINQAIKYSDDIIVMKNGKLIHQGSPKDSINKKLLKEVYKVDGIINQTENEVYFIPTKVC